MKGHVYKRGEVWYYRFDADPDPLTGKRRQINGSGYQTEKRAWRECRTAIADYERGQVVDTTKRKVATALEDWLTRIEHSIKPSMAQNWRDYAKHYVVPYIGQRGVHEITGEVCDALYAKLLVEGRVKARGKTSSPQRPVHVRRLTPDGRVLACRPHHYENTRCHRMHEENDPLLGQPIESKQPSRRQTEKAGEAPTGSFLRASTPRRWSTRTGCFIVPGRTSPLGAGPNATSSATRTLPAFRARSAEPGTPNSSGPFCSVRGMIGSSRSGYWKLPQACGAVN
jgi:hypothetical protein